MKSYPKSTKFSSLRAVVLCTALLAVCFVIIRNKRGETEAERDLFDMNSEFFFTKSYKANESEYKGQIFFIESRLSSYRNLNARQACSVESAARMNPTSEVFVFLTTDTDQLMMANNSLHSALTSYRNIHLRHINIEDFTKGTKAQTFFESEEIKKSSFRVEQTSDVLRIVLLNKYSGFYMDLDTISLVPMRLINRQNFICIESQLVRFANGILRLDDNEGKKVSEAYLDFLQKNHAVAQFTNLGPDMMTPAVTSFCKDKKLDLTKEETCGAMTLLPTEKCFPFIYSGFTKFYKEENANEVFDRIKTRGSYFAHIWNRMLSTLNETLLMHRTSKTAYVELAKVYCPRVFDTVEDYF